MYGFIIGNGESRKKAEEQGLSLQDLKKYGKVYGCNALYEDFVPDSLISVDGVMISELFKKKYHIKNEFIFFDRNTNNLTLMHNGYKSSFPYNKWASGPTAIDLMCYRLRFLVYYIFLIGFDFYSLNGKMNNVYKGRYNYRKAEHNHINPVNWFKQCSIVFNKYDDKEFYRVMPEGSSALEEFKDIRNYSELTYKQMFKILKGSGGEI